MIKNAIVVNNNLTKPDSILLGAPDLRRADTKFILSYSSAENIFFGKGLGIPYEHQSSGVCGLSRTPSPMPASCKATIDHVLGKTDDLIKKM